MLTFSIKKKWYDEILSGRKKEEYRVISKYYISRLGSYVNHDVTLILRNGYSRCSPSLLVNGSVSLGTGRPDWGAVPGVYYFIIKIDSVTPFSSVLRL